MSDPLLPPQPAPESAAEPALALLHDLRALGDYLEARGAKTFEMAQRFADNARRHPDSRAYDERQATMLEYQHYIWKEIAGLVTRLVATYEGEIDHSLQNDHDEPSS